MRKRLFIGIEIPSAWQKELANCCYALDQADIKCTVPGNIHITVTFLGNVEVSDIPSLIDGLRLATNSLTSFDLTFESIIFAPPNRPAKMIWALFQYSHDFKLLVHQMRDAVKAFSSKDDHKNPIPHATLARIKSSVDTNNINLSQPDFKRNLSVTSVVLFESVLLPKHPEYTLLQRFTLQ
ncbi:MAG: RNA 2',3'-cyclic phosphodiesterase [Candidatus Buchananbacteria bacterium CG10_big_fil_rev_8_21_14_0_10_42_9]|uniref:RNA 2',3'-cyclic phosphodiesterase n=1 Tax=Candidatus Buchananbacteria bacterium CG10_big_fil_rev_8_21_14_0_10_42_9 TaxID=1974526 RepID=A0A2H0W4L3_9BACT|nr:MAG: RNA 2',3'-cyclic phosphodiesterase [Candidatus Buchananbacteria bacterium CG10_big_fil_rev_8_21_14_0_10_42_9]